ncbi:MAG TPA: ScyD/ScyE family protein [Actinomycetota bacterium]|nr:ScyD/ScyE family protein [Actinomycetota bacterium]
MIAARGKLRALAVSPLLVGLFVIPEAARAASVPEYEFATPVFGLATAPDGSLLVADAGAGIVELRKGKGMLIVELPGVTDMAPRGRGSMWAVTGGGEDDTAGTLFRVSHGKTRALADLIAFEAQVNPDEDDIESNPFDVAALSGGKALVADAAGNDLLVVDQRGKVDWVATLPEELVSTQDIKDLVGCPNPPPEFEEICDLPPMLPADPVPTGVTIGPDGAYYVGELKGFPAPRNESRVWRIEPGTRHAKCGESPACTVVADGFTSIIDLNIGPDGTIYVTEFDEASWFAIEIGDGIGGTVNACNPSSWSCTEVGTGLPMSIASTVGKDGTVYAAIKVLIPGEAEVIPLT